MPAKQDSGSEDHSPEVKQSEPNSAAQAKSASPEESKKEKPTNGKISIPLVSNYFNTLGLFDFIHDVSIYSLAYHS